MLVLGGTYWERVIWPASEYLWGSGLRGAASIVAPRRRVRLASAVAEEELATAQLVAGSFGLDAQYVIRREPIRFNYFTPISNPEIEGVQQPEVEVFGEDRCVCQATSSLTH